MFFILYWMIIFFRHQYIDNNLKDVKKLIKEFQREGPFHGLRLVKVKRSTLTAIFSTIVTYVIVIVQFQPTSKDAKHTLPYNSTH